MKRASRAGCGLLICVAFTSVAHSAVIVEHSGSADPQTEGFSFGGTGVGSANGGTEANWRLQNAGAGSGSTYSFVPTVGDLTDSTGWTATLRLVINAAPAFYDSYFEVGDGSDIWGMVITPTDARIDSPAYTTLAALDTTAAYHTYQVVYDPTGDSGNGSATFYIDGVALGSLTRAGAYNDGTLFFAWGDGTGAGTSDVQYSQARLETGSHVVPEPTALAGLALAVLGLRRRQKSLACGALVR